MARSFNSTDVLLTSATFSRPATFSGYCWAKNPRTDTIGGRAWEFGITVPVANAFFRAGAAALAWDFTAEFSTTGGAYRLLDSAHGATLANWNHYAIVYDGGNVANVPTLYVNGVPYTMSQITAAVGTYSTGASVLHIGNRTAANRSLGSSAGAGQIAHVGFNNVLLTAGEVAQAMYHGFTPRGLYGYWPIHGSDSPEANHAGAAATAAVTGTTVVSNPPIQAGMFALPMTRYGANPPADAVGGTTRNRTLLGVG